MLISTFCFALMNACIKKISYLPAWELVGFRSVITFVITLWIITNSKTDWLGKSRKNLILRGLFGSLALYFFFRSLALMPLATAVTIQFTSPLFTTLIGTLLNREKVSPVRWLFLVISFAGVLLLKGFDTNISAEAFVTGLASAVCSALAYNMVRKMKEEEHPQVIVLHFQAVGMVAGLGSMLWNFEAPALADIWYILAMGILTYLGQIHLTHALQGEKLGIISSLNYIGILYALVLGWIFFHEPVTAGQISAILLIVTGVLLNILYDPLKKQTA